MNLRRIKELSAIHENDERSYFYNFWGVYDIDPLRVEVYEQLESELQTLDQVSWEVLKSDSHKLCLKSNSDRGWSKLFEKLNEAKGYSFLKTKGFEGISFIPCSKENSVETPDLKAYSDNTRVLCEVKTINESDELIDARKNIKVLDVKSTLTEGLKQKLEQVIRKAHSQLMSYDARPETIRYVYLVISHDDGIFHRTELNQETQQLFSSLGLKDIKCVIHND